MNIGSERIALDSHETYTTLHDAAASGRAVRVAALVCHADEADAANHNAAEFRVTYAGGDTQTLTLEPGEEREVGYVQRTLDPGVERVEARRATEDEPAVASCIVTLV